MRRWALGPGRWEFAKTWWGLGFVCFAVAATANGAGYRYGVSDQAFYIPAIVRALDPAAFPRDASLIDSQGRFILTDEVIAAVVRMTGLSLEALFFAAYLLSLLLIWIALSAIGRRMYPSAWLTIALAAAFTLRHRIPRTSANSFEPYFHPRMLAFGVGALAIAALLRRRLRLAVVLVGISGFIHVTTGLWFAVLLGVAMALLDRRLRNLALAGTVVAGAFVVWGATAGPLRGSFTTMDTEWLAVVANKDSLFASDWPLWAWAMNLSLIVIGWAAWRYAPTDRRPAPEFTALLWGATALVALFLLTLPFVLAKVALPVQLQISRVFWLVEFVALIGVIGLSRGNRTARAVGIALVAVSLARGAYAMTVEHPNRPLVAIRLPVSDWEDAMRWIRARPNDTHVLAHPGHAWKYGSSVRISARHDVFLEEVKDSAIAIYSRDVAVRSGERTLAIGDFDALTADSARELARRYDLDYLVAEADLPLPVAYKNSRFRIYSLTTSHRGPEAPRDDPR